MTTAITTFVKKLILNFEESNDFSASQPSAAGIAKGISPGRRSRACHKWIELITPKVHAANVMAEKTPIACKDSPESEPWRERERRIHAAKGACSRKSGPI